MRLITIVIFAVVSIHLTTGRFTNKKKVTHKDLVEDSAKYGEQQLEEFIRLNRISTETTETSFETWRQKKEESTAIEYAAVRSLEATKKLISITGRCLGDLQDDEELLGLWQSLVGCNTTDISCDETYPYRSENGSCNNVDFPEWGMAFTPQLRFVAAHYDDGIDTPRDYDLPSPRLISNKLFNATEGQIYDNRKTAELMAWGQFLAHDIVLTPTINGKIDCCLPENEDNPACYPIEIPDDDAHFQTSCMNFVRSSAATEGCIPTHREQINEITTYIDGSMLYGSAKKQFDNLREFQGGRMRCTNKDLLPENVNGTCQKLKTKDVCQLAGDGRVDVVPNLGGNHVLLMREHNRIADQLADINTHWDDERIFQETRKIIAAETQHITYAEYLPMTIGSEAMMFYHLEVSPNGHDDQYDPMINPSVRNAFAAAAFRFGHSMIMPEQAYLLNDYITFQGESLVSQYMNTQMIQKQKGKKLPDLMRWLSYNVSMGADKFFEKEVRDLLFPKNGKTSDLPARNIQRGRDHGLPSYNEFREYCGLSRVTSWNSNKDHGLVDHRWRDTRILKELYQTIDEIDLYAGAMSEKNVQGGLVGPTFACLLGEQFHELKAGDRFWYERPDPAVGFEEAQLNSIKRIKLAKLFCENFGLDHIQKRIFNVVSERNEMVDCDELPDIDFQLWKEN